MLSSIFASFIAFVHVLSPQSDADPVCDLPSPHPGHVQRWHDSLYIMSSQLMSVVADGFDADKLRYKLLGEKGQACLVQY